MTNNLNLNDNNTADLQQHPGQISLHHVVWDPHSTHLEEPELHVVARETVGGVTAGRTVEGGGAGCTATFRAAVPFSQRSVEI